MYCPSHSGEWMLCNTAKGCKRFFCDWPHSWRNGFNLDALLFQLSLPLEGTRHHDDTPQNLVDHHFGTQKMGGWTHMYQQFLVFATFCTEVQIVVAFSMPTMRSDGPPGFPKRDDEIIEGSLEVKLPTTWTDEKQRWEESEKRREEERRSKKRKSEGRKKIQVREKVGKSRNTVFFPMICGSKSRLAKAAGAEPAGQVRDEKLHAVVARSTFPSQNVQNTPFSDHFWKLRCRKNARRCGAKLIFCTPFSDHFWKLTCCKSARRCGSKHISKSKVQKTEGYGPLLHIEMSFCVAGAGDSAPCQKWAKRKGFVAASTTTTTTLHCTPLQLQLQLHYITLHYTTLQ